MTTGFEGHANVVFVVDPVPAIFFELGNEGSSVKGAYDDER
jgi:hypothetical protein